MPTPATVRQPRQRRGAGARKGKPARKSPSFPPGGSPYPASWPRFPPAPFTLQIAALRSEVEGLTRLLVDVKVSPGVGALGQRCGVGAWTPVKSKQ